MTRNPKYCVASDAVAKVASLMRVEAVGAIPVCGDRRGKTLIGIITDRDLAVNIVAERRDPKDTTVQEVMTRDPFVCQGDDEVEKALDAMSFWRVRRIPVVARSGKLIGIISLADVAIHLGEPVTIAEILTQVSRAPVMQAVSFRQGMRSSSEGISL